VGGIIVAPLTCPAGAGSDELLEVYLPAVSGAAILFNLNPLSINSRPSSATAPGQRARDAVGG
jgi:hypothetical protein